MPSLRRLVVILGLGIAFLPGVAAFADPQRVVAVEVEDKSHAEEIRNVLLLKEGDVYDPILLDQSIAYLKKWGRFREIAIHARPAPGGVILHVEVKEGVAISGIDIYGTYPYLSTRIRRMITVHSGDLYDEEKARAQTEKIEAFYARQGYDETEVTFAPKFHDRKPTVDLSYRIERGTRYRIGKITVQGNTVFPPGYFNSRINPLLLYKPTRMRKSIDRIRKDYQGKGYLGARVRLSDLGKNKAEKTVNPVITIREGKHVTVDFEGNRRVRTGNLKKIMPIYTDGGYSRYEIEASAKAILDYYRKRGFQETTVSYEERDLDEGGNRIAVTFHIREGPQTRVKAVAIEGNREVKDKRIKRKLLTKENSLFERGYYQPRTVARDFENLPAILSDRGALDAKAIDHDTKLNRFHDKAEVTFFVEEGPIVRLEDVRFEGNEKIKTGRLKKRVKSKAGGRVRGSRIEADKEALTLYYANHGFPYAAVVADVERDGDHATLTFRIHEGSETQIGDVLVVGNERTEKRAVLRAMRIRPGQPFSFERILASESQLRRSGAFRSVNIQTIGLKERQPVVHLLVKLEEYRKILLDLGVSYDTDNSFTGEMSLSHINLGGTIRRANLRLIGGRDIQKGEVLFKDPFFIGYPFDATVNAFIKRSLNPGFKIIEGGGSLGFLREFTPQMTFLGRYELVRTFFSDVVDDTGLDEEDHTTSKFSFSFNYDKRNSFADPSRGYVAFAGIDISNRLIASTFNFIQPKGLIAYYFPLSGRVTLINFLHVEGIKVFGSEALTRDKKLFLGGDYSVRGFDQDAVGPLGADGRPAGGQLLLAATTELQLRLFNNFKLALFVDHGSITNDFSEVGLNSFRHSAGLGLRYVTPVGPLRLDYGFKLDKRAEESVGRLHFAFGYAF